jgi:hypothetical protein
LLAGWDSLLNPLIFFINHNLTLFYNPMNLLQRCQILKWIPVDHDQVGQLAGFQGAGVIFSSEINCRIRDR